MELEKNFFDQLSGESGPDLEAQYDGGDNEIDAPDNVQQEEGGDAPPASSENQEVNFDVKSYFPDYESIDDIKAALERVKSVPKDDELNDLKTKAAEYSKHNEFIEKLRQSGLNNDYIKLNALEAAKNEKASIYKKMLFSELSDVDLVKLDLIDKYPELSEDSEMLQFQLEEKYPNIFGEFSDDSSDAYQKEKKKMKFDAMQVNKRLKSEFDSVELPESLRPDYHENKQKAVLETWKNTFDSDFKDLTKIDVSVDGQKFMDLSIPEGDQKEYKEVVLSFLAQNGLTRSKENLQKAKEYVRAIYVAKNLDSYNKAILEKRAQMSDAQWRKLIHNPSTTDKNKSVQPSESDSFIRFLDELDN